MHRIPRAPWTAISIAAALAVTVTAQSIAAADPEYRADITPAAVAAGIDATFTLTLTHLDSTSREMGSVRITPPAGIDLTSATARRGSNVLSVSITSGFVTVGNLQLNDDRETATVTLEADVPCGASGARTWTVEAIKNQSFDAGATLLVQDPGSELTTQVDRCTLAFVTQPRAAAVGKAITGVAADPDGTPISVQLRDGNGNAASQAGVEVSLAISAGTGTAGSALGGTSTDSTNSDGAAVFAPTIDRAGRDYRLVASASGITASDDSAAFDISDVAVDCSGACSGSSDKGDTSATVSAETNGILTFSLGLDGIDCNNSANRFYASSSEVVTFDVTAGVGRTTVTITLAASSVTKVAKKYEVCFSSPASSFTNTYGVAIAAGQAGLLPACPRKLSGAPPCVVSKDRARNGDIVVKFSVPTGDPRGKI